MTSRPEPASLVGARVDDRFELTALVSAGGAGDVYAAVDREGGRSVAVKVFGPAWANDEDALRRLTDDIERVAALDLPEVVKHVAAGRLADGRPYIASDLVLGASMETAIEKGARLAPSDVVALLSDVGSALDTAHSSGVILRTLSPRKLMLPWDHREPPITIVGLGTGGLLSIGASPRAPTVDIGAYRSLAHCAPEAVESSAGAAADVYTVAAIAYQLMSGVLPADFDDDPLARLARKRTERATAMRALSHIPFSDAVERVLATALAPDPAERYQAVGELLADLARAAQGRDIRGPGRARLRETAAFEPTRARDAAATLLAALEQERGGAFDADTSRHRIPD
jgi:serine/threonine-protein kinase